MTFDMIRPAFSHAKASRAVRSWIGILCCLTMASCIPPIRYWVSFRVPDVPLDVVDRIIAEVQSHGYIVTRINEHEDATACKNGLAVDTMFDKKLTQEVSVLVNVMAVRCPGEPLRELHTYINNTDRRKPPGRETQEEVRRLATAVDALLRELLPAAAIEVRTDSLEWRKNHDDP